MRLLIVSLALVVLLAACGGGASPSATPTGPRSGDVISQGRHTCQGDEVQALFRSQQHYSDVYYLTFTLSATDDCWVTDPPKVHWYNTDGDLVSMNVGQSDMCEAEATDFSKCLDPYPLELLSDRHSRPFFPDEPYPALIVSFDDTTYRHCVEPTVPPAATVGFTFGDADEVKVDLPEPLSLNCGPGVSLAGYGPHVDARTYAQPCTIGELAAAWVFTGVALGTDYHEFNITNTGVDDCRLSGPPQLRLLDDAGNDLDISYQTAPDCPPDLGEGVLEHILVGGDELPADSSAYQNPNETDCVTNGVLMALAGQPVPATGVRDSGQITLTVAVANVANFDPPCDATLQARSVAVSFPGIDGELLLEFPGDVAVQTCYPQVIFHRFD